MQVLNPCLAAVPPANLHQQGSVFGFSGESVYVGLSAYGEPVAGNHTFTKRESASVIALVAPAAVKKFAGTPVKVYPFLAVSVTVALYCVSSRDVSSSGSQTTVPGYHSVAVIVVAGVSPVTGAVTPGIASIVTACSLPLMLHATQPVRANPPSRTRSYNHENDAFHPLTSCFACVAALCPKSQPMVISLPASSVSRGHRQGATT